jgi:phenol hydroxylase P0 protein
MLSRIDPAPSSASADLPEVDTSKRFVRVTERRADGLVAFDFAIGWPELSVELMLPAAAFDEFCAVNRVILLDHDGDRDPPTAPEETDE